MSSPSAEPPIAKTRTRNRLLELVKEFGSLEWVRELEECGDPLKTDVRALQLTINDIDRQLQNLERQRDEVLATVRSLWKPAEIVSAKAAWSKRIAGERTEMMG